MCQPFETHVSISNGYLQTTGRSQVSIGRVRYSPDPYTERVAKMWGHHTRTTIRSPTFDAASNSAVNHRTHVTRLTRDIVRVSNEFTSVGATHWMHRVRPVQRPMLRPVSPEDSVPLLRLLQSFHQHNRKYAFHFLKSTESGRACECANTTK